MSNGRLSRSALGPITRAVNGEQAYLRKDAAKAFMAMNAESVRRFGVTLRVASARTAYRTYAEQQYFWSLYQSGRGSLAARPGTSNHGLGLAIDLASPQMRSIVDKIGAKYGWEKRLSDAASEWWHLRWTAGNYPAVLKAAFKVLGRGARGARVKWVQRQLRAKGFKSVAGPGQEGYGYYGLATAKAVRRLQRAHRLTDDGKVGPATWRLLGR